MLARNERQYGDQELMGWWYVHQDFNGHRCASSDIISGSTNVIFLELSTPGNWPTQFRDEYRLWAVKFRSIMSPCWRWACGINKPPCSLLFLIHTGAQRHERCNFVCALTYSTPPKISRRKFRVQSCPAPLVAMAWNYRSECNGNNLESLSFLILWRILTVCVQRLHLNVSLQ